MVCGIRRRQARLLLGVNRKSEGIRWMGMWTVRVHVSRFRATTGSQLKADKGAEKSCRSRRRLRGQRKGKRRSRGCQPRRTATIPTLKVKEPTDRQMTRRLRTIDHFDARVKEFDKLLDRSTVMGVLGLRGRGRWSPLKVVEFGHFESLAWYQGWRARWRALHGHIKPFGEEVLWCSGIGPSFAYHMEQRFRLVFKWGDSPPFTARVGLQDMQVELSVRESNKRREIGKRSLSRLNPQGLIISGGCNRACRSCGYFGPPPHQWNQCGKVLGKGTPIRRHRNKKK